MLQAVAPATLARWFYDFITKYSSPLLCSWLAAWGVGAVWLTQLLQQPMKLQLTAITKFVDEFDEKRWKPMMAQIEKMDDRVKTVSDKAVQTAGVTLLGVAAAWGLGQLAEAVGRRRSPPRSPPPT
jgi:hypothetical protein